MEKDLLTYTFEMYNPIIREKPIQKKRIYFCLFCGEELDFVPDKYGGFCSTRCKDGYNDD